MSTVSAPTGSEQSLLSAFVSHWLDLVISAIPTFIRLIPLYILITVSAATISILLLLSVGKATFHLACMMSPLIFILIGLAIRKIEPEFNKAYLPAAWYPIASRFWRYATPMAVAIGLTLNCAVLFSLGLADLNAFYQGKLPNLTFTSTIFTPERVHLIPMLLTTSIEQQLMFMPLFVVLGGRLEPHLIGLILSGRLNLDLAKQVQKSFTKRERFILGPLRLLVLIGIGFQYWGRSLDAHHNVMGTVMLLVSYFGWLFYACMLAHTAKKFALFEAKKNPA